MLHDRNTGLGGRNQTFNTCSQSTYVITTLHRDKTGAGYQNRTDNERLEISSFAIKLIPQILGAP